MKIMNQMLRRPTRLAACLIVLAANLLVPAANAKVHLKISATSLLAESFKKWTATTPWEQIDKYDSPFANRPTVDLLLQLQALKAGGLDFDFELDEVPNYGRAIQEVTQGKADLMAETLWDYDTAENAQALLKTDVIIRNGEFEKGIYVLPGNEAMLKITTLDELRQHVGITVDTWAVDIKTVEAMRLKGLEKAPKIENLFLMIQKQRADFTLLEFASGPDMSCENSGVKLVPVPGCKVAIQGERAWVIAKSSPNATPIQAALAKGVPAIRAEGRIERAFKECGFLSPKVADWKRLF